MRREGAGGAAVARYVPLIDMDAAGRFEVSTDDGAESGDGAVLALDPDTSRAFSAATFAVWVPDQAMEHVFRAGDIVIVDPQAALRPGDPVIAHLPHAKLTVLRLFRERFDATTADPAFDLTATNDDWPSFSGHASRDARVIGPVIEHRRRLRGPRVA